MPSFLAILLLLILGSIIGCIIFGVLFLVWFMLDEKLTKVYNRKRVEAHEKLKLIKGGNGNDYQKRESLA